MLERFAAKKRDIINRLSKPEGEYEDLSPKGGVDDQIRDLVDQINSLDGFVTTSSCAGRMAVYLAGPPKQSVQVDPFVDEEQPLSSIVTRSSTSGKGGGRWLFTSHTPLNLEQYQADGALLQKLGFSRGAQMAFPIGESAPQFVHLKFEPMILHIATSGQQQAQVALTAALEAGFRESGIGSLLNSRDQVTNPTVAVRTSGLSLDSIIGFLSPTPGRPDIIPMVSESYLRTLVRVVNERFRENEERTMRFRFAFFKQAELHGELGMHRGRRGFESRAERAERKRFDGLRRREERLAFAGQLDGVTEGSKEDGGGEAESENDGEYGLGALVAQEEDDLLNLAGEQCTIELERHESADAG